MDFKTLLKDTITRPDQIKLSSINPLDTIEDSDFRLDMSNFLTQNTTAQLIAVFCISAYQSNKLTFLFSRRIFEALIQKANELNLISRKTLSGTDFKDFMMFLRQRHFVDVIVQGTKPYEASLVKIVDNDFKNLLVKKAGLEFFNEQEKRCIEVHKSTLPTKLPVQTSSDIVNSEIVSNEIVKVSSDIMQKDLTPVPSGGNASLPIRPQPTVQTLTTPVLQAEPQSFPASTLPPLPPDMPQGHKDLVNQFLRKRY